MNYFTTMVLMCVIGVAGITLPAHAGEQNSKTLKLKSEAYIKTFDSYATKYGEMLRKAAKENK